MQADLRAVELVNLRLEDVIEVKQEIHVRVFQPKENAYREVLLKDPACQVIADYLRLRPRSSLDHLFIDHANTPIHLKTVQRAGDSFCQGSSSQWSHPAGFTKHVS